VCLSLSLCVSLSVCVSLLMKTMKKYREMWKDAKREEVSLTKEKEQ